MTGILVQWLLYAIALLVVSKIVPGFHVAGLWPALIASLVIGLLNATLGFFLKVIVPLIPRELLVQHVGDETRAALRIILEKGDGKPPDVMRIEEEPGDGS